jgi:C-terminal peptidase prc
MRALDSIVRDYAIHPACAPLDTLQLDQCLQDPYAAVLDTEEDADAAIMSTGGMAGIGASMDGDSASVWVVRVLPESPAAAARLQGGDKILEADGQRLGGMSPAEAAAAIRGAPGTTVALTIARHPSPHEPTGPVDTAMQLLTRAWVPVDGLEDPTWLQDSVLYVRLSTFNEGGAAHLRRLLEGFSPGRGLILDLRGNTGGMLHEGAALADVFLSPGDTLVRLAYGPGRPVVSEALIDEHPPVWPGVPVSVLVDGETASASEITVGALRAYDRATIVGPTRTYGKGLLQQLFTLPDQRTFRLTTGVWLPPRGEALQEVGPPIAEHGTGWLPDSIVDTPGSRPGMMTLRRGMTGGDSALGERDTRDSASHDGATHDSTAHDSASAEARDAQHPATASPNLRHALLLWATGPQEPTKLDVAWQRWVTTHAVPQELAALLRPQGFGLMGWLHADTAVRGAALLRDPVIAAGWSLALRNAAAGPPTPVTSTPGRAKTDSAQPDSARTNRLTPDTPTGRPQ